MSEASRDIGMYRSYCYELTSKLRNSLRKYDTTELRCLNDALDQVRKEKVEAFFKEAKNWTNT